MTKDELNRASTCAKIMVLAARAGGFSPVDGARATAIIRDGFLNSSETCDCGACGTDVRTAIRQMERDLALASAKAEEERASGAGLLAQALAADPGGLDEEGFTPIKKEGAKG